VLLLLYQKFDTASTVGGGFCLAQRLRLGAVAYLIRKNTKIDYLISKFSKSYQEKFLLRLFNVTLYKFSDNHFVELIIKKKRGSNKFWLILYKTFY
jgi:hypothetical protein